jgi:hypothetical protein
MTPLAIVGYVLILVIIAWIVMGSALANSMIMIRRDVSGPLPSIVAIITIIIIGISGISAVVSLTMKK